MSEEEEKVYGFGPSVFSTPERLRARFNVAYQTKHCLEYAKDIKVTKEDLEKYSAAYPEEGERLKKMHNLSSFTGYSTVAGFLGSAAGVYRITKSPPLLIFGTFLSTISSHLVSDDIGSWIYGTYKFDNTGTTEKYLKWVHDSRQPAS